MINKREKETIFSVMIWYLGVLLISTLAGFGEFGVIFIITGDALFSACSGCLVSSSVSSIITLVIFILRMATIELNERRRKNGRTTRNKEI